MLPGIRRIQFVPLELRLGRADSIDTTSKAYGKMIPVTADTAGSLIMR
jgi:hypothetical protein|uniref:Uncharacterized protein n=1 Tax=Picea glauca TaxID=3330 RepID=A0A101LZU6_PICGL|nr:hypothetical protein ABT39_MTgene5315 [Picea glauca]